jgi:hypothetical protein
VLYPEDCHPHTCCCESMKHHYCIHKSLSNSNKMTERCGRAVNTPASYSGGPGFKSWPWQLGILIEVFPCFPQSFQVNVGIVP